MLCKRHWIVLYTVYFTAFCLGAVFSRTRCSSAHDNGTIHVRYRQRGRPKGPVDNRI